MNRRRGSNVADMPSMAARADDLLHVNLVRLVGVGGLDLTKGAKREGTPGKYQKTQQEPHHGIDENFRPDGTFRNEGGSNLFDVLRFGTNAHRCSLVIAACSLRRLHSKQISLTRSLDFASQ